MENILFARPTSGVVVIRICGRGNHLNAPALRKLFDATASEEPAAHYVFDLEKCESLDSTFMGIMATIGMNQQRRLGTRCTALNVDARVREQLDLIGLKYLYNIRSIDTDESVASVVDNADYQPVENPEPSKLERIVMMIEAHETLVDLDTQNEVKFKGVLQNLRQSYDRTLEKS